MYLHNIMYTHFINKIWVISWCNRNCWRNQFYTLSRLEFFPPSSQGLGRRKISKKSRLFLRPENLRINGWPSLFRLFPLGANAIWIGGRNMPVGGVPVLAIWIIHEVICMENLANVMHSVVLVQWICMNSAGNMRDIFPFFRLILRCRALIEFFFSHESWNTWRGGLLAMQTFGYLQLL